jgi:GMP synthase-like glutamine amidotransferase
MEFAVIDNNRQPMTSGEGRGQGFAQALAEWTLGKEYEFVRFEEIGARRRELLCSRGLILSGSAFDLALPDDGFDRAAYETMIPEFQLMHDFKGPILGICFGHQLMAIADEFDPDRTEFGGLRLRNMATPPEKHAVLPIHLTSGLRFLEQRDLWAQFHHKQEVVRNDALLKYYDIIAGTEQCPVHVMQHRHREWFGVQFHPEIGKETKAGAVGKHDAAVRDGCTLLRDFVRYCLR